MATGKIQALKTIIEEQRRDYDYLLKIYDRAGAKENVLLTASFGILAYLYHAVSDDKKAGLAERLSFPTEDYGRVIYIIAFAIFAYGFSKLMLNVFGDNNWETAYETSKNDYTYDEIHTLEYVKDRYDKAHLTNVDSYMNRKKDLTVCFYGILVGAIILIVIKTLK